jgi:predicted transcriptional regulator
MNESIHDYVVAQLQASKGYGRIALATGISKRTIEKIARRESRDPAVSLVERLNKYFRDGRVS